MICFSLLCGKDHRFDSWFASSQKFETLMQNGHLSCPMCGDSSIRKGLMAPAIATSDTPNGGDVAQPSPALHQPMSEMEYALAQMRAVIEQHSDYVGLNFAAEARAMHLGDLPSRPIFGEAKIEDAKALLDDGIPVAPLPFLPRPKVN